MNTLKRFVVARIPEAIIFLGLTVSVITFMLTLGEIASAPAAHFQYYSLAPSEQRAQSSGDARSFILAEVER